MTGGYPSSGYHRHGGVIPGEPSAPVTSKTRHAAVMGASPWGQAMKKRRDDEASGGVGSPAGCSSRCPFITP